MKKLAVGVLLFTLVQLALSQARIDIGTRDGIIGVKIALPPFQPTTADAKAASLTTLFNQILRDDLEYSGGLTVVSSSLYPLGKFSGPGDIKPEAWTVPAVDAQFLAFGSIRVADGKISAEARLWDLKAPQNREAIGKRFGNEDSEEGTRLIAHAFADEIIELIGGGVKGLGRTNIAYISERTQGVKDLYVMDYDGNDQHALTNYRSTVLSPSWSPDKEKIAFTTFRRGSADIEVISPADRRSYPFERFGGTTAFPSWSPDGSKVAFSTSRDGSDMEIYVADWNGKNARRLTVSKSVDTSPVWNPRTGRQIAFTSDRSGNPQVYIMDVDGTNVQRLVEEGGHAVEPSWSPDGQRIAFAWQLPRASNFNIYIHDLATGKNTQITSEGSNEKPTWAPDGRHIAFESTRAGGSQIFSMILDGTKVRQLTKTGKNTKPAWSGFAKP